MFNEGKDREALARILDQHDPEGGVWRDDIEGYPDLSWWYPQVDAILAAGFHRTPAPVPDVQAHEILDGLLRAAQRADYYQTGEAPLLLKAFDALKRRAAVSTPQDMAEHDRQVAERAWDEGRDAVIRYSLKHVANEPEEIAGYIDQHIVGIGGSKLDNPYRKEQENNNA